MTDCEHLIENALNAIITTEEGGSDSYKAFCNAMARSHNVNLLRNVYVTRDELWEMAYYTYLIFTDPNYQKEGESNMYDACDIAKYIITKCTIEGHAINNLQLGILIERYLQVMVRGHKLMMAAREIIRSYR